MTQQPAMEVVLARSQFGNPEPRLYYNAPAGTHYRHVAARLYGWAGLIESLTMSSYPEARWVLRVETHQQHIALELFRGDAEEIHAAMVVLREALRSFLGPEFGLDAPPESA